MFGDSVGKPFEFMLKKDIMKIVPNSYMLIKYIKLNKSQFETVSDDSQLLYATIKTISQNLDFYTVLEDWLSNTVRKEDAPGDACIYAAQNHVPDVYSKGPGALMRMPAYSFLEELEIDDVYNLLIENSRLTHSNLASVYCCKELLYLIENVNEMGSSINSDSSYHIDDKLDVWTAEQILATANSIISYSESFPQIIYNCVVSDGDSDTLAAITLFLASYKYPNEAYRFLEEVVNPLKLNELEMYTCRVKLIKEYHKGRYIK